MNPKLRERAGDEGSANIGTNSDRASGFDADSDIASDTASGVTDEAGHGSSQVQKTARGTALNLVGSIVGTVIIFITVGVITRTYGRGGAGVFFAVTALYTLASNGARLGAETSLTFFVSRLRASGQYEKIRPLVYRVLAGTAVVATTLGLVGFAMAPALAKQLTTDQASLSDTTLMIRILAAAVPTLALTQSMFGATRGFETMRPSVIAGQIVRPIVQLLLVIALVVFSPERLWPLAAIWGLASLAAAISIARWLNQRLKAVRPDRGEASGDKTGSLEDYVSFTGPRAASDLLSAGLERLDVILVAAILGEAAAGLYGTANRLILAGQLLMIATAQSMAPHLSASFSKGETDESQHMLRVVTGWNVMILWPMFLGLAFGAEPALSLFGEAFVEAAPLVRILALAFLVITGLGTGDTVLMMTGGSKASLANHAISLVTMIGACLVLLPSLGVIGAAMAWAFSRIVLRGLAGIHVYRSTGIHALGRPVIVASIGAVLCFVPTGVASIALFEPGFAAVAFHATVGGALYLVSMSLLREQLVISDLLTVVKRK